VPDMCQLQIALMDKLKYIAVSATIKKRFINTSLKFLLQTL